MPDESWTAGEDVREFDGIAMLRVLKAHPDLFEQRLATFLN